MQRPTKAATQIHASTFLVLDLGLDGGDGVAALDLEDGGLPRQRLHEDLHLLDLAGVLDLVRGSDRLVMAVGVEPKGSGAGAGVT
jgi:hypothetical protein